MYFSTSNKRLKKQWLDALNYPVLPYPKGNNETYHLGTIYKPVLIDKEKNIIHIDNENMMKIEFM